MRVPGLLITVFALGMSAAASAEEAGSEDGGGERLRVLVLDLSDTGALGQDVVKTITGLVAVELSEVRSLDIVSGDDVRRLAELEADRQLAGCDEASCLAEIAGALGARYVVFGQAGRLGELLVVNLSLFDSEEAQSVGRSSVKAANLEELPAQLGPALRKLMSGVVAEEDLAVLPAEAPPPAAAKGEGGFPVMPVAAAGGGAGLTVAGLVLVGVAFVPGVLIAGAEAGVADDKDGAIQEARDLRALWYDDFPLASTLLWTGVGLSVAGLAMVGGGVAAFALGGEE